MKKTILIVLSIFVIMNSNVFAKVIGDPAYKPGTTIEFISSKGKVIEKGTGGGNNGAIMIL